MSTTAEERRAGIAELFADQVRHQRERAADSVYEEKWKHEYAAGVVERLAGVVLALLEGERGRVPSESEGGRSTSESECRELAAELRAEGREGSADCILDVLDALARSRRSSVTEGSVDRGSVNVRAPESASVNATSPSAGPEVLPHVPDTAGEVDVMPGRVRT